MHINNNNKKTTYSLENKYFQSLKVYFHKFAHRFVNRRCNVMLRVRYCFARSGPSPVSPVCVVFPRSCAKPLPAYLRSLLFSLRAETPSLWTNTFRKTSAPPQNHFYHWPRQYTLTKGLKRPGPHASRGHRECKARSERARVQTPLKLLFKLKVVI